MHCPLIVAAGVTDTTFSFSETILLFYSQVAGNELFEVCEKSICPIKMSKIVTMSQSISILNIHLSFVFFEEKLPFYTKDILLS